MKDTQQEMQKKEKEAWTGVQHCRSPVFEGNLNYKVAVDFALIVCGNQYIAMGNLTASVNITVRRFSGWL